MFIVLGGTGQVGSAVAHELLAHSQPVTVVTRNAAKGESWKRQGAEVAVMDVHDVDALRALFRQGRRAFLLNPPADPSTDTDVEERKTVQCLLAALDGSGLEKVVAQSVYGAQPGERLGDLTVLYEFEEGLRAQPIPATIQRAGYYMSNWGQSIKRVREEGVLPSLFPAGFALPMVAPDDLGRLAAHWLSEPVDQTGLHHVEGPERYSSADVAAAFANALGHDVKVEVSPRDKWEDTFRAVGFSEPAAHSYAGMTAATVDNPSLPKDPVRGKTSLQDYISALVKSFG